MIHILGDDIFSKYVIVKGKKKYKLLCRFGGMSVSYDWLDQERMLEYGYIICLFNTHIEAADFIANLPQQKQFKDAEVKNLTVKLI